MTEVDAAYVNRLREELKTEFSGLHKRMSEIESIRYLEDDIGLPAEERSSGLEIRIGATGELIENVKAALTSNVPVVVFKPLRSGSDAKENSNKREKFWAEYLKTINTPVPVFPELADAQAGPGVGILKGMFYPWPKTERRRLKSEPGTKAGDKAYKDRQKALKRLWGPPFRTITIHPLTFFFRLGDGNQIVESIEHSYKPRRVLEKAYGKFGVQSEPVKGDEALRQAGVAGQPDEEIRPLPAGADTSTMALVTEYWNPELYQVYVNNEKVWEEKDPSVRYFLAVGRTTSSKDPDKFGMSVAELMRHNEPTINRALTRVAEAMEIVVRQRQTVELPEGSSEGLMDPPRRLVTTGEGEGGESNEPVARTWRFKADVAEALPAGAKLVNVFEGAESVFGALPFIQFMMQILGTHGVSPIFKGIPPGAAGSGYRDNSIYLMALSQFQYILDSFAACVTEYVRWMEEQVVKKAKQEVFVNDLSLTPEDIRDFPSIIEIHIEPLLPQNIIAMGQFYARMHAEGHATRRMVIEKGMREQQPEEIIREMYLEDAQAMMQPILIRDVLQTVGAIPPPAPALVGPDGKPISSGGNGATGGPGGVEQLMAEIMSGKGTRGQRPGAGEAGQAMGGYTRAGQSRQPPEEAGASPGLEQPV